MIFKKWVNTLHYILNNGYQDNTRGFIECNNLNVLLPSDIDADLTEYNWVDVVPNEKKCTKYAYELLTGEGVEGVEYTYGQRLCKHFGFNQIEALIKKIKKSPNSTSLYLTLWDNKKDYDSKNPPCLTSIWFRCREDKLDMFVTFRSHDIYRAWLLNTIGLYYIHSHILRETGKERGVLNINSYSAHIYQDCINKAREVVNTYYKLFNKKQEYCDPIGNFIIERQGDKIIANLYRNKTLVGSYSSTNKKRLIDDILQKQPYIEASHTAYICQQIYSI